MNYCKEIEDLLEIEKKILKVYDSLISCNEKDKNYMKHLNNLDFLIDYEKEKFDIACETKSDMLKFYAKYNMIDFTLFDSAILKQKELYKYRLTYNISTRFTNEIGKISNEDMAELYIKYIWNIEEDKDYINREEIKKIQYYICYIDRIAESFFMDNIFSFNKPYGNLKISEVDRSNRFYRTNQMALMNFRITYSLDKASKITETDDESINEYIYLKNYVKSAIETVSEEDFNRYMRIISVTEPMKYQLLLDLMDSFEKKGIDDDTEKTHKKLL